MPSASPATVTRIFARVETLDEADQALAAGFDGVVAAKEVAAARADAMFAVLSAGDDGAESMIFGAADGPGGTMACFDRGPTPGDLDRVVAEGAGGILLRTTDRVLDASSIDVLAALARQCHAMRLTFGLDGRMEPPDVPRFLAIGVDLLVFGEALRAASGALDPACLAMIRDLVPRAAAMRTAGTAPPASGAVPPDRIFVRDLVLEIAIGAYASEHGRLQRVRFAVEADLTGTGRATRDMRDIVSYDLITDTILDLTSARHVEFVETLAKEIAARILSHPRVALVRVRVEKLDLGPGAVGVELVRAKT